MASDVSGRKRVVIAPGHSLVDWVRLGLITDDLSGVGTKKRTVTLEDLAKHNRLEDLWMSLRGKVYNITPYVPYHPGGAYELMRAAGKDGTELFDEVHNWVSIESMMEKCFVGDLEGAKEKEELLSVNRRNTFSSSTDAPTPRHSLIPTQDWYQTEGVVTVIVNTTKKDLLREYITTEVLESEIIIHTILEEFSYLVHFKPFYPVKSNVKVTVVKGTVEVSFEKVNKENSWFFLGVPLEKDDLFIKTKRLAPKYRSWTVTSNTQVNYNTVVLRLKAPEGYTMLSPVGYHIAIILDIQGMQIGRSYTLVRPSFLRPYSDPEQEAGHAIYLMMKYYPSGILTPWLTKCKPGDTLMVSNYAGNFDVRIFNKITHLIFFGAGTGVTAFINVITYALNKLPNAKFPVHLVNCNRTRRDIWWKDQLDELAAKNSRFAITNVLSQESKEKTGWAGQTGRVSYAIFEKSVPLPGANCFPYVCICGQWEFNDAIYSFAKQRGLSEEHIKGFSG